LICLPTILVLLWLATGLYVVGPGERGLVFRFGRLLNPSGQKPGLHMHLPWPMETVRKASVSAVRRVEIGFRTQPTTQGVNERSYQWESRHIKGKYTKKPEESILFTGDENLIDVNTIVQYRVAEVTPFLLHLENPERLIRSAAEEAIRKVVGMKLLDDLLTAHRVPVENRIMEILQTALDDIGSGIQVTTVRLQDVHPPLEVVSAFREVASAREDKNRLINEAYAYCNQVLPLARGEAAANIKLAEGEKQERTDRARGEADKFIALLHQYQRAREVTEVRMFLETMEQSLTDLEKFIVEPHACREALDLRFFSESSEALSKGIER